MERDQKDLPRCGQKRDFGVIRHLKHKEDGEQGRPPGSTSTRDEPAKDL